MQIESLKVFCDLAESESFTKAAKINHVTQSAVSQQISSLERQFKSLLIERSKKKFRLTREGQVLYDFSKQIIQTYDTLHNKLQEIKDIISGTIRGSNQVYEDVQGNVVDLGLVAYPVKDSKLEIVALRKDALLMICHPQHPFA